MNERKWDLDLIRIIACVLVVIIHVAGYGMEIMDPKTLNWQIRNLVVCMARCTVPIFFMLSGILFLNREISIKKLYKKYISHILAVWVIWSLFYACIDYIAYLNDGGNSIFFFAERFFLGHYHLWFLASLLAAYVLYPLLHEIVHVLDKTLVLYLGALTLLGLVLKETVDPFLTSSVWDDVWNDLAIPAGFVGIVYFVLGYYLYRKMELLTRGKCLLIYGCAVALIAGVNMVCSEVCGISLSVTYGYLNFGVLVSAIALFLFLLQSFKGVILSEKKKMIVREISECTLGIYLMHTFFIEQVFRRIGLVQEDFPTIIAIILFSALAFIISLVFTWGIRRIPVCGKWLV